MTDYSPLSDGNAFPADAPAIAEYGRGVQKTGELIAESVRLLRRCADENNWETEAADAFREKAEDLAKDVDKSRGRYASVGASLVKVSGTLDRAQVQGASYASQARQQEGAAGRSEAKPGTDPDGADVPLTPEQATANHQRQAAIDEIARLQRLFDGEVGDAKQAADDAAGAVRGALDDDVKDSWWDRNAGWLKVVTQVLGVIIAIAAIVLLTVATGGTIWVIAMVVTVAAGLLSLGIHVGLAASGNGSWWDVAFDAVGLLSFGAGALIGKALGRAMPALRAGITELKGMAAFDRAFSGTRLAVANFLSRVPLVGSRLGGAVARSLADDAFDAMNAARAAAATTPVVTRAAAVLQGGREAATNIAQARQFLADLRALTDLPPQLVPDAAKLLDDAARAISLGRAGVVTAAIGTVGGLAQTFKNLADGLDLDDLKDGGSYAQVITDILSRFR